MRRRKLFAMGLGILFLAVVVGVVYQRATRLPRTVLLLPEGNIVLYANLKPAPFVNVSRLAGVDKWIESDQNLRELATDANFHVDKDLDEFAMSFSNDPNPGISLVARGRFDQDSLKHYLQGLSSATESYAGRTMTVIERPRIEKRFYACVIDSSILVLADSQTLMHTMVDKVNGQRPAGDLPPLIREYYPRVPFGSMAWMIFRDPGSGLPFDNKSMVDVLVHSTAVVSVRYFGSTLLRAEINSLNAADAAVLAKGIEDSLASTRAAAGGSRSNDASLTTILGNTRVRQEGARTVLDLNLSDDTMRKLFSSFNR